MNKIFKVAQREFLETVKTKAFLIGILITPLLMAGLILLPSYLTKKSFSKAQPPKHLAVLNLEDALAADLDSAFANHNESSPGRQIIQEFQSVIPDELDSKTQALKQEILDGKIDALLVIESGVIEGEGRAQFYTLFKKITDFEFHPTVQRLINNAVTNVRYRENDLSRELFDRIRRWVPVEEINLGVKSEKKRDKMILMMLPFFFMFLMFMGVFATSQGLLNSVVEEKSSRVIEVLLAAVTPFQLMAGKIIGQSMVGLTLMAAYGACAYAAAVYHGLNAVLTPSIALFFIIYFILGFLIIASILAAIGSACNSLKETQNMLAPITMILILPMLSWFYIAAHPDAVFAVVLSFIPPITPMVMILRIVANPDMSLIQIVASILLLVVSVPLVMWVAAKIFRTGILMYGKPPSLKEIVRWVRYG